MSMASSMNADDEELLGAVEIKGSVLEKKLKNQNEGDEEDDEYNSDVDGDDNDNGGEIKARHSDGGL